MIKKIYLLIQDKEKNLIIKACYKAYIPESPYICNVFFIVLDLRLTKVGVQRYSFFYARTLHLPGFSGAVCKSGKENGLPHSFYITVSPTRLVIVKLHD